MPTPNFYAVGNYNRICAAVKGVTEDPLLFCPSFSAALEDTSPHEPAYDLRRCVIAVGMETAPCSEVSKRERAVMAFGFKVRRVARLSLLPVHSQRVA
jgi:hypothetical protein